MRTIRFSVFLILAAFSLVIGGPNLEAEESVINLNLVGNYNTPGSANDVTISGNYAYVSDGYNGMDIINIVDPTNPSFVANYATGGYTFDVAISESYAYVGVDSALFIIDIEEPNNPTLAGNYHTGENTRGVAISGNYAYVANGPSGLVIIDIEDPANPTLVGNYNESIYANDVNISGNYAYVAATSDGLVIINIEDPTNPTLVGILGLGDYGAWDVSISGNYAYAADLNNGLIIIDIEDPTDPTMIGYYATNNAYDVAISGNYAYITHYDGLFILDIRDPTNPTLVGSYEDNDSINNAWGLTVLRNYVYISSASAGLGVLDVRYFTSEELMMPIGYYESHDSRDVSISGNYAYVADGYDGLKILDIEDPTNPTMIGYYAANNAYGVAISGNYAYVAARTNGLFVINIEDPTNPTLVGNCDTYDAWDVSISGNYAYVANGEGANRLVIIDIEDPANPTTVGYYDETEGYARDLAISGNYAYIASGNVGVIILDIEEPNNPTFAGNYATNNARGVTISGNYAYVASGYYGVIILDIEDPANPTMVGNYDTGDYTYDIAISESYAYVADGGDGLIILDIEDPTNPILAEISPVEDPDFYGTIYSVAITGDYTYVAGSYALFVLDKDSDGDRFVDSIDPFPLDRSEWLDTDGDGTGNNADLDDDNDGLTDIEENNIGTNHLKSDTDGDGYCDWLIAFDICLPGDAFPTQSEEWADTDKDGFGDNIDAYPNDSNESSMGAKIGLTGVYESSYANEVTISGNYAYVADGPGGLVIIDIEDPANPTMIGNYATDDARGVAISGNYAYIADLYSGLIIIDIEDPTDPTFAGNYETHDSRDVSISGNYAYVAWGYDGLKILDIEDPANPTMIGYYDTEGYALGVTISGNYAYVVDGDVTIIDIEDPANPTFVGKCATYYEARDVTISENYAYIADGADGLIVLDIEKLTTDWRFTTPMSDGGACVHNYGVGNYDTGDYAYDVSILGHYAYVTDGSYGLVIINILDPTNPTIIGNYDTEGYARSVTISGNYFYVADGSGGVVILSLDSDYDGLSDLIDAFPHDALQTIDSDGDGVGDTLHQFIDFSKDEGSRIVYSGDPFPMNPDEWQDTDWDGFGDNGDAFPTDPTEWLDSDGDGFGDNKDAFPNDIAASEDSDGDGYPDEWNDNMSRLDSSTFLILDEFSGDGQEWADNDGDGIGNNGDVMPNFSFIQSYLDLIIVFLTTGFLTYVGVGHKYTESVLSEIEEKLENKKAEGIDIDNIQKYNWVNRILEEGKWQWKILDYIGAVKLFREADIKIAQLSDQYISTERQLTNVDEGLKKLENTGVNVTPAIEILEKSREQLSNMEFQHSHNSSARAEEIGIQLEEEYYQTIEKISELKEKIKHLSEREIKVDDLKELLKAMEKEVAK